MGAANSQSEPAAQPHCMTRQQVRTCGQQVAARQHGQAAHSCLVAMQGVLVEAPAKAPRLPHLGAILCLPAPAEGVCRREMVFGYSCMFRRMSARLPPPADLRVPVGGGGHWKVQAQLEVPVSSCLGHLRQRR